MSGHSRSGELFRRALSVMPGGVSSPVRAFKYVGGEPLFIRRGRGAWIWDADGNRYVDYVNSWGAIILGHANAQVVRAATRAVRAGSSFGAPTVPELELAEEISGRIREAEKVRFVNSGTEAAMTAIRLARAYTGRKIIVKFEGNYHGHSDAFLSRAGSGLSTLSIPSSPGVPDEVAGLTMTLKYNSTDELHGALSKGDVAAVIVEPVAGNMGVVPADREFIRALREMCDSAGCVLIFDEVITGFRVGMRGAIGIYGVSPDLVLYGKVIGGGFPLAAVAGKKEIMSMLAPEGPVYQAGTLAGNPVAAAAGLAVLKRLKAAAYESLESYGSALQKGVEEALEEAGVKATVNRVGSMMSLFFTDGPVKSYDDVVSSRKENYVKLFWGALRKGIYLPPSPFESMFFTLAHGRRELSLTLEALKNALKEI